MRMIHVIPAISEEGSGPSYSVPRLCQALIDGGHDVTLAGMDLAGAPSQLPFVRLFPVGVGPRRLGRAPALLHWLRREVASGAVDAVHSHGMWQMNAVYPARAVSGTAVPLVVSPRGAFSHWAMQHGSRFKWSFWRLLQRPALERAACFHITSEGEYEDVRRLGFRQPVALIPNGVDVPAAAVKAARATRTLLFLGRIHRTKGIDVLLQAWSLVMRRHPDWTLSIVGSDTAYGAHSSYRKTLERLAESLSLERVGFHPPSYGSAKWEAYRNADVFVLPTHSESFGMTVAESLAAGTPAIVTTAAPWGGLDAHACGWSIGAGVDALAGALDAVLPLSSADLAARGANGRRWMEAEFSWQSVGARTAATYEWLRNGGAAPSWVTIR